MRSPVALSFIFLSFILLAQPDTVSSRVVRNRASKVGITGDNTSARRLAPILRRRRRHNKRACVPTINTAVQSTATAEGFAYSQNKSAKIAGLAWNNADGDSMADFAGDQVTWFYTWSPWPSGSGIQAGLNFVPMLWGAKQLSDFNANSPTFSNNGVTHILGFNEPNESGQSNMSSADAITLWKSVLIPMRQKGFQLVSPACSGAPNSIQWYTDFLSGLSPDQQPDAIAVHYYGTSATDMISYLENIYSLFGKPIWLTEFACENFSGTGSQCTSDQVYQFMYTALLFLNHTPWIQRHSWFGALRDMSGVNTLDCLWATQTVGDPALSSIGWLYAFGNI